MPYACSYEVPADEETYQRVKNEIGPEQPAGLLLHLVVQSDGGIRHIGVWESRTAWERFRDERVRPAVGKVLQAAGWARMPPPPVEQELQVVDFQTGA